MCGICGIVERERPVSESALAAMTETLRHRGPDDRGLWVRQPEGRAAGVGLGFRRLSIIDVDGGNQPIANEDGTVRVVCNGEIYNYRELRSDLISRGHVFATGQRLRGARPPLGGARGRDARRAQRDVRDRALGRRRTDAASSRGTVSARSRCTTWRRGRGSCSAPSSRLFWLTPTARAILDQAALEQYLAFDYVPAPRTAFEGIRKLPAGHALVWHDGTARVQRWWELPIADEVDSRSEDEWTDEFLAALQDAVSRRLVSDVPLGAFLSGGLDSSAVVALMARSLPPGQLKTFSIGFDEPSYDESAHARAVARHVGAEHHERTFTVDTLLDLLPEVFGVVDEPFADASILPTYLLSRFAREHVTVALGGDGSDELLAGYPTFQAERANRMLRLSPWLRRRVRPAARRPPAPVILGLQPRVQGAAVPPRRRPGHGCASSAVARILHAGGGGRRAARPAGRSARARSRARGPGTRGLAPASDRSLRGDLPPGRHPHEGGSREHGEQPRGPGALPRPAARRAPRADALQPQAPPVRDEGGPAPRVRAGPARETIARPKKGFGIPVAKWLRDDLRSSVGESLSPDRLRSQGLFDPQGVAKLLAEHNSGARDHRKQLWALFAFQQWHHEWLERPRPAAREVIPVVDATPS